MDTRDLDEVPRPLDHDRALGTTGDVDASSPTELKEPLFPQGAKCPKDSVAVDSEHCREVDRRRQSIPGPTLSLADRAADLGRDLLVKRQGLCRIDLDEGNRTNHNGIMVVREAGTKQESAVLSPSDSELLIKEAHEHRIKRWKRRGLVFLAIVLAAAATGLGVDLARPSPMSPDAGKGAQVRPPPHQLPLRNVIIVQPGGGSAEAGPGPTTVATTNAASGRVTTRSLPPQRDTAFPWVVEGRLVVAVENLSAGGPGAPEIGTAYAFDPTTNAPPQGLGPATYAVAALEDNAVWLIARSASASQLLENATTGEHCSVEEVTVVGRTVVPQTPLPCAFQVASAVPGGLLVRETIRNRDETRYEVWSPVRRRVVRRLAVMPVAGVVPNDRMLAWETMRGPHCARTLACTIDVLELATGHRATWRAPAHRAILSWALEPRGGSDLAVLLVSSSAYLRYRRAASWSVVPVPQRVRARLVILNGKTGRPIVARGITATLSGGLMWAPDGGYVFTSERQESVPTMSRWIAYPSWTSRGSGHAVTVGHDTWTALLLER